MAFRRKWLGIGLIVGAVAVVAVVYLFADHDVARQTAALAEARYEAALSRAEAGDAEAQFAVAEALRRGDGGTRDPAQAMRWYRKAAEKSHVGAQYALGTLYEKGEGVARDYSRAEEWYRLAANLGDHADAEFALAQLYFKGQGIPSDPDEAVAWYRKAANGGNPAAQYVLGTILKSGWNVQADPIEAYKWFTLAIPKRQQAMAVDKGFDPVAARAALAARMTEFQIMRGKQAAANWRPRSVSPRLGGNGLRLVSRPAETPASTAAQPPRMAVRLFAFDLPVRAGKAKSEKVSLLVEFSGEADKAWVCGVVPRIRDAVIQALWSQPKSGETGPSALAAIEVRLSGPVNKILGLSSARQILLHPGDQPLSSNDALRTPFNAVEECATAKAH